MKQCVFLFLFALSGLFAQVPDYFPLVSGSTWVYRSTNGLNPLTIKVGAPSEFKGQTYLRLEGYAEAPYFVRQTEQGNFVYWDSENQTESPFLTFRDGEFKSVVGQCRQTGRPEARPAFYKGPVGVVDNARVIRYSPGICADAGLTSETFAPYLGMVQRTETSFTGERTLDLIYAQIGGITYISDAGVSFSITLGAIPNGIAARLVLHNRTGQELKLVFPSGQRYEFSIRDAQGVVRYTWSADKLFIQEITELKVTGEEVWNEVLPAANLPAGVYTVEGRLAIQDIGGKKFSAIGTINLP